LLTRGGLYAHLYETQFNRATMLETAPFPEEVTSVFDDRS
jgi:hypothetical protein